MAIKNITVPDIGGADQVEVIEILVKVGDSIEKEAPLITMESDKATMDLPASEAGTIQELKVKVGDKVSEGSVIAVIVTSGSVEVPSQKTVAEKQPPKAVPSPQRTAPPKEESETPDAYIHASPSVRKLARELEVNLEKISPTGPKNRITQADLNSYIKSRLQNAGQGNSVLPKAPEVNFAKFGEIEKKPLSKIRKLTGKNLQRNWLLAPHVTQFAEADITELEAFRQAQKGAFEKQNIKLTPLVFIMKAVIRVLKLFPQFNASLDESGENLILKKYFHIGVAVDTQEGLVVPVIYDVDKKGLGDLAHELSAISEKARHKQLMPQDMQGGCFSISSLGGIGGTAFTPIINLPEVAILGVSTSFFKPVYQDNAFVPRLTLPLSLSYDHRVIDGADGARFIMALVNMLADIRNLLL